MAVAHSDEKARAVDLVGRRLMERYAVKEKVARGGMGVVFRGEDERLYRSVCVKVFATLDPSRPEYRTILEHFVQEAFTLSRLQHPNTLRIYDFGYVDEERQSEPFFVTEYADAGNLAELVEETGPLAATEVLRILEPMVGALTEAHDAGIIHRDIKPSNILFTSAGGGLMPKLADFSIAKARGDDLPYRAQDTNVRVPLYSLSWAAPEQLTDGEVGPTSDVFALGLTTAFMFTGQLVYPGSDIMKLYNLRSQGEEHLASAIDGLPMPVSVAKVVHRASAQSPDHRHPTVEAFFDDLADAVDQLDRPSTSARPEISIVSHSAEVHRTGGAKSADKGAAPSADDGHWDEGLEFDTSLPAGGDAELTGQGLGEMDSASEPPTFAQELADDNRPTRPPPTRSRATQESPRFSADSSVVSPINRDLSIVAPKPRRRIEELRSEEALIGSRRIRLHPVGPSPLEIPGIDERAPPRLRVTPVDVQGSQLHVKGLNCFVAVGGRRPSSGASVTQTSELTLYDAQMKAMARLRVVIASTSGDSHVFSLGEVDLELPTELAKWAVFVELANARDGLLLYR